MKPELGTSTSTLVEAKSGWTGGQTGPPCKVDRMMLAMLVVVVMVVLVVAVVMVGALGIGTGT